MKIVYDHQIFSTQYYGGISRYFVELAGQLTSRADADVTILAPLHMNELLRQHGRMPIVGVHAAALPRTTRLHTLANDLLSRAWLTAHRPSIIHETYYRERSLGPAGTPTVVTVYDMIHERFDRMYHGSDPTARRKAAAIGRADAVICIS